MRGSRDPLNCCPICGGVVHRGHCAEKTYRGIDAANTAAINAADPCDQRIPAGTGPRPEVERLAEGFRLLGLAEAPFV